MAWLQHLAVNQIALQSLHDFLLGRIAQAEKSVFYVKCAPSDLAMIIAGARGRIEGYEDIMQFVQNNMHRVSPTSEKCEVASGLPVVP